MRPLAIGTFIKLQSILTSYVPPPQFIRRDLRNIEGFTLIEILIILVIVGISFSFALLAFGDFGKSRQAQSTAEQVKNMIQYFREQAIIESSNFTINIRSSSYQVSRADANAEESSHPLHKFHQVPFPKIFHSPLLTLSLKFIRLGALLPLHLRSVPLLIPVSLI